MKTTFMCLLLVVMCLLGTATAQTFPNSAAGANIGFCQTCDPQVNGGFWYAKMISSGDHPLYSFSTVNISKIKVHSLKPVNIEVMTTTETGFAQHVRKLGTWDVYALAYTGPAVDNDNLGLSYGGGSMALHPLGSKGWFIGPYLRGAKQTIAKDVGWQIGVTIGDGVK